MARTCTWDGGGADNLASNAVNWDTNVAPVTGDSIVFPTTTKACTWDINLSLVTFTVNAGYVQTITQNSGANMTFSGAAAINGDCTINLSATATFSCAAYSQTTGTVNCAGGSFTSTTFTLNTGSPIFAASSSAISTTAVTFGNSATLTATSGTWTLAGSWTQSGASTTFTHNSGTINITAAATITDTRSTFNKFTLNASGVTVTIAASTTCPLGTTPTSTANLTVTGTLTYAGTWTHTGTLTTSASSTVTGSSSPSLTINQSLTLNATSTWTSVNITASGTLPTTYTDTGAKNSGTWTLNKTTNNNGVIVAAGTTMALGANPSTVCIGGSTNGLLINGTVTASGAWTHVGSISVAATGVVSGALTSCSVSRDFTVTAGGVWVAACAMSALANGSDNAPTIVTDTGGASTGTWTVTKTNLAFTVAASTTVRLGTTPSTTCGTNTFTVTGTVTFAGTWSHTGNLTATGTVTGTASPLINITEGTVNFTSYTLTNPIDITMTQTSATSRTFTGGGKTYLNFRRGDSGTGTLTIASSNTFSAFYDDLGLAAHTLTFTASTTQTASQFYLAGSSGKTLTINSSIAATAATLTKTGPGSVESNFLSVRDSTVDASPKWYAGASSTNVSGNTNWLFVNDPSAPGQGGVQEPPNALTWRGCGLGLKYSLKNGP